MEQIDIPAWVLVVGVVAGLLVFLIVQAVRRAIRRERERQQRLAAWAQHHGWTFARRPPPDWGWTARLPGRNRGGVSLAMRGTFEGYPVTVAEYSYTTSSTSTDSSGRSTQSETTWWLTVAVVRLRHAYPAVEVAPRGALSRLVRPLFGERQISTGNSEFDDQFKVKSKDPDAARGILGPALIAAHLSGRVPAWTLDGNELMTYRQGLLREPDDIAPLVGPLLEVARLAHR